MLRREVGVRKIKVVFLVSELSKWKGQSVWDKMKSNNLFEPSIAVIPYGCEMDLPTHEVSRILQEKMAYFYNLGMNVRCRWDIKRKEAIPFNSDDVDILFYQQPWEIPAQLQPSRVSRFALTYYFPYYVQNNLDYDLEVRQWFHRTLYRYIVFSNQVKKLYEKNIGGWRWSRTVEFMPFGHPMLDNYTIGKVSRQEKNYVIYAPHFSIKYGDFSPILTYSTFIETGKYILEFAKSHPEINWVFKPHPGLRTTLVRAKFMSESEVEGYYREWESIGTACYTADYVKLFLSSRAIITDCGSFLTEYAATGRPIIRLLRNDAFYEPHPSLKKLYATYYEARSKAELGRLLKLVVLNGKDPLREIRQLEARNAGLIKEDSAVEIVRSIGLLLRNGNKYG